MRGLPDRSVINIRTIGHGLEILKKTECLQHPVVGMVRTSRNVVIGWEIG